MKPRNISFAEVLRKTAKSPRLEKTATGLSLQELMVRFNNDPSDDYTLYLGNFATSHRSKPASRMAFSRNTASNQEQMFDSWIQKQSAVGANKENIRNQPHKTTRNEPAKRLEGGFRQTIARSKAREDAYPANSVNSQRLREEGHSEEPNHNFPSLNIEMVKSNGYECEQAVTQVRSPRGEKLQPPQAKIHHPPVECDRPKFNASEKPTQIKVEPTFKNIKESKESEKNQIQFSKATQIPNNIASPPIQRPNKSFENRNMRESVTDIMTKYNNANYSPQEEDEPEDDQLLLESESNFPSQNNDLYFNDTYAKKAEEKNDAIKKRTEDAKSMIENYLGKIMKEREELKKDDFYLNHQGTTQPNKLTSNSNQMVGYSFSNNFQGVNQSSQNQPRQDNYIPEAVSEAPDEVEEPLSDSTSFKAKYLNLKSFEIEHNEYIPNIQSVKYEGENNYYATEQENLYAVPNESEKIQLISSKQRSPQQTEKYESVEAKTITEPPKAADGIKDIGSFESNHSEAELIGRKPLGKNRQKISLMSSKSRSNKASPTAAAKPEKEAEVATTDFALNFPKEEKQQEVKSPKTIEIKAEEASNSFKCTEVYQFTSNNQFNEPRFTESSRFISNIPKAESRMIAVPPSESKAEEPKKIEYIPPTYAKPSSRIAEITSDYYSTANYCPNPPAYQQEQQYEAPTYGNHSKLAFISSKNYEQLPLKVETPYDHAYRKEEPKKQSSYALPATNSIEQKYALPTSFSNADKEEKKNYLTQLQIKQSITLEQAKPKVETNPIKTSISSNFYAINTTKQFKTVNPVSSSRAALKLSLKQSINVAESGEFIFDL